MTPVGVGYLLCKETCTGADAERAQKQERERETVLTYLESFVFDEFLQTIFNDHQTILTQITQVTCKKKKNGNTVYAAICPR